MILEKIKDINMHEAIIARHSVRKYFSKTIPSDVLEKLKELISDCNKDGQLNIQLVTKEKKAFNGIFAYGKFYGVENYIVMIGKKSNDLDEKVGYYGEQIVLYAQSLGLNTCWAGLSYKKVENSFSLTEKEKVACMISIGYGENQGIQHKCKSITQISNASEQTPNWFRKGVESALLAPTAVNQQKYNFRYAGLNQDGKHIVIANRVFSLIGYTHMDLGIAKLHFEIGAGKENFVWA